MAIPRKRQWLLLAVLLWSLGDGAFIFFRFGGRFRDLFEARFIESWAKANVDGETLARATFIDAAHGRHIAIVASVGNPNVAEFDGLSQGRIETDPAASRQENFNPGMRSLAADDFLLLGAGSGAAGYEIAGNIACGQSTHADGAEQDVGEILADPGAQGERVRNRGMHVRRAFHVGEIPVDKIGGGVREAIDGAVAGLLGSVGNFRAGSDPIEVLLEKAGAQGIEFRERHAAPLRSWRFMYRTTDSASILRRRWRGRKFDHAMRHQGSQAGILRSLRMSCLP